MKTLLVYYSLTGKTEKLIRNLQKNCSADCIRLSLSRNYLLPTAYLFGIPCARAGRGCALRPMDADISAYNRIILAGPVWGGAPAPPLIGFLRSYDLSGQELHILLTYSSHPHNAAARFCNIAEECQISCASVTTFHATRRALSLLESEKSKLILEDSGAIAFCREESE